MTPDVVVDVGNSRIKWGRVADGRVAEHLALPPGEWPLADEWGTRWAVAGVHPERLAGLTDRLRQRGHDALVIERFDQLPLAVEVSEPARVGIDRLLGVLAASRRVEPGEPAVTVDVGTAVTINLLTRDGAFGGGCILPGPWLMARALHDHTAKLPLVEPTPGFPAGTVGRDTASAIRTGIQAAVYGAVDHVLGNLAERFGERVRVFVTGGGSDFLSGLGWSGHVDGLEYDPCLVLDGIRLAAEALP